MRTLVINLPSNPERRDQSAEKLQAAGVPFEFFDGITYDEAMQRNLFDGFDEHEFLLNTGRHITPGEVGCFAAHREAWAEAVKLGEPLMIMEDDFQLADNFANAVAYADEVIDRAGFLRLQWSSRAKRREIANNGEFAFEIYTKPPQSMMCYCITPEVARKFIEDTRILDAPVDVFVKKYWEHGQPLYAITPYPVWQSPAISDTTIKGRARHRKPLHVSIHRFLRKARWYLRRWAFNRRARQTIN